MTKKERFCNLQQNETCFGELSQASRNLLAEVGKSKCQFRSYAAGWQPTDSSPFDVVLAYRINPRLRFEHVFKEPTNPLEISFEVFVGNEVRVTVLHQDKELTTPGFAFEHGGFLLRAGFFVAAYPDKLNLLGVMKTAAPFGYITFPDAESAATFILRCSEAVAALNKELLKPKKPKFVVYGHRSTAARWAVLVAREGQRMEDLDETHDEVIQVGRRISTMLWKPDWACDILHAAHLKAAEQIATEWSERENRG